MLLVRLVLGVLVWCINIFAIATYDLDGSYSTLILGLLFVLLMVLGKQVSDLWGEWKQSRRVPASTDVA